MIFTAWGRQGDARPHTLVGGNERPRYVNGEPMEDCERLFWTIEAADWNEANQKYHALQGWAPYTPME